MRHPSHSLAGRSRHEKTEKRGAEPFICLILSGPCDSRCGSSLHIGMRKRGHLTLVCGVNCRLLHGQCLEEAEKWRPGPAIALPSLVSLLSALLLLAYRDLRRKRGTCYCWHGSLEDEGRHLGYRREENDGTSSMWMDSQYLGARWEQQTWHPVLLLWLNSHHDRLKRCGFRWSGLPTCSRPVGSTGPGTCLAFG